MRASLPRLQDVEKRTTKTVETSPEGNWVEGGKMQAHADFRAVSTEKWDQAVRNFLAATEV